jgi:hypothetical protein
MIGVFADHFCAESFSQSSALTQQGSAATQWPGVISRSGKSMPIVSS